MSPKIIIGLTGKAGAGKDTIAAAFPEAECLAFVKPLKDAAKELFNFTDSQLYDNLEKEIVDYRWNKSPREILQWLGTDVLRNQFNKDIFSINMMNRIKQSNAKLIIITDLRFDNEAELIKKFSTSYIIKVERENNPSSTVHSTHSSESGINESYVDYTIVNDSDINDLQTNAKKLINSLINF